MIRWIRRQSRPVALGLVCSLAALAALSASPHQMECADEPNAVVWHDADGHAIGAVRTTEDPLHCVLCHWIRSFSADGIRALRIVVAGDAAVAVLTIPVEAPRGAARFNIAPRAPPI